MLHPLLLEDVTFSLKKKKKKEKEEKGNYIVGIFAFMILLRKKKREVQTTSSSIFYVDNHYAKSTSIDIPEIVTVSGFGPLPDGLKFIRLISKIVNYFIFDFFCSCFLGF